MYSPQADDRQQKVPLLVVAVVVLIALVVGILVIALTGSQTQSNPTSIPNATIIYTPGICLPSPLCEKGEKGDRGADGLNGIDGADGLDGIDGAVGPIGPRGFNGTQGPQGIQGFNGTQGPQGPPGTCDCFNISSISFDSVSINQSFALNGTFTCAPGSTIDLSCLTPSSCPDFSGCALTMLSGLARSKLQIGSSFEPPTSADAIFGDRLGIAAFGGAYQMFRHLVYAQTIRFEAAFGAILSSFANNMDISALGGGSVNLYAENDIILTAPYGRVDAISSVFHRATVGSSVISTTPLIHSMTSSQIEARTNAFSVGNGISYYITGPDSYQCPGSNGTAVPLPGVPANNFYQDVVLHTAADLISTRPDGFLSLGPSLEIQSGRIKPGSCASDISIDAPLRVDNITSVNATSGPLDIMGTLFYPGGVIYPTAVYATLGSCCTSDARAKRDVATMQPETSLARILSLRPVEFSYTDEYLDMDPRQKGQRLRGFIAQELETQVPGAVHTSSRMLRGEPLKVVSKEDVIPDLVAAIAALQAQILELNSACSKKNE